MKAKTNSIITSSLIGIMAYMCTAIVHEVVGHGGMCLLNGNEVDLLTSVYFRSSPGSYIVDLAGPISNLLFGILLFVGLKYSRNKAFLSSYLLLIMMSYNLFWFSGTLIQSAFSKTGDWTYTLIKLHEATLTEPILITAGLVAYLLSYRLIRQQFSKCNLRFSEISLRQSICYSYVFATLAAMVAGLFFNPDRLSASREGLLEMAASLPILFIRSKGHNEAKPTTMKTNRIFFLSVGIAFILFCFTLGKGIY